MSGDVRLRDGVVIELAGGETVALDGGDDADATVVSHAHGDHLVEDHNDRVVASELTAALASERQDAGFPDPDPGPEGRPAIELHDAGHVAGSRAAVITDPESGRRYCYTGDCCTRDRFYLSGFDPPDADVLVTETTYGVPEYVFPPTEAEVRRLRDWLADTTEEVVILFGYALGRAQKLQRALAGSERDRVFVTDAIAALNEVIAARLDVSFDAQLYGRDVKLRPGDALVLPLSTTRLSWIESLVEETGALTAGASGWAADDSFIYRRGLDEGFVLSDHCDFEELVGLVRSVDPEVVYTQHGNAEAFARHLTAEHGYRTRALVRDQRTLGDF